MKNKWLAIGIILLFIVITIIPSTVQTLLINTVSGQKSVSTQDRRNWNELQKLVPFDGDISEVFGDSVSLDGDTALIGASGDDDNGFQSGSAYVYIRVGSTWVFQAKLHANDGETYDLFGCSVSLSNNTALIGASEDDDLQGSAYVFIRSGTTWTQQAKLLAADGLPNDLFGFSVSLRGDTALIGAPWGLDDKGNASGAAYVFTRSGTTWVQQAKLPFVKDAWGFGVSVCLNDDSALIGAPYGVNGSAYVFTGHGSSWKKEAKLNASDESAYDRFGIEVSLDRDTAIIGASDDEENGPSSGSVYVFIRQETNWTQQAKLLASDGTLWDWFGDDVSLSGDTAVIGAWQDDYGTGSAYLFTRTDTTWSQQQKLLASDHHTGGYFGQAISLSGNSVLIGEFGDNLSIGSAYVFVNDEPPIAQFTWVPQNASIYQTITFNATSSTDPDGMNVLYEWDWDNDGQYEETQSIPLTTYSWLTPGNYTVTLRVTDDDGLHNTRTERIAVNNVPPIQVTITGGLMIKALIKNSGTVNLTDIPWSLHVGGGIYGFINKTSSGIIDILPDKSVTEKIDILFGFGPILINAKISNIEQIVTGTQFFIFSVLKK